MRRGRNLGSFSLVLIALLLAVPATAQEPTLSRAVNEAVRAALRVAPETGVHVARLDDGATVYEYRADTPRIAASNTKLATTAAALERLGPGFFFETEVLARGTVRAGILAGELAIVGGGDPHISGRGYFGDSFGAFREWAAALRRAGITRVDGDVLLVHGLFEDGIVHPDWPREQLTRWYEAPVSALSFNDNCVLVKVRPGDAPGHPAEVETVPELPIFRVENGARTSASAQQNGLRIDRRPGSHALIVSGRIYRHAGDSIDKWVTVEDPLRYFGSALLAAFAEEDLAVGGAARPVHTLDSAGGGWRRVHVHRTDLLTVVEVVNKRSQNFYAESLLKVLGARHCGGGTWEDGLKAVREVLDELGVPAGYSLADGSGMSRGNRFSPRQLTHLLRAARHRPWGDELMRSLPYSGERGLSWAKRLATPPYRGNVLAKTGSLAGVTTLSGYVEGRSGKRYAFSILCNRAKSGWQAKTAQNAILRAIIDHG